MYNFNFMYIMKKLLLILFTISLCFNVFSQDSTYTYEKYGVINQYTNNMVLEVDDILRFSKHKLKNENCFIININDLSSSWLLPVEDILPPQIAHRHATEQ